jgi:hypothetical protein
VGEKLLREVVVGKGVDLEGKVDILLSGIQNGLASRDTGIIDQDCGVAERCADFGGGGGDGGWR